MRRASLVAGIAFLAASSFYLFMAARLPLGTSAQPGPGLFPRGIGVFLIVVSATFVAHTLRRPDSRPPLPADAWRRVTGIAAALAGFCLILPWLGYLPTAFGLLLAVLRLFGQARWRVVVAVAFLTAAISYYVFVFVLDVPLPAGPLSR